MRRSLGALLLLWLGACGEPMDAPPGGALVAQAPLLGEAGVDAPDYACHVVLRSAARARTPDGQMATDCVDGACWFRFTAEVDISHTAAAEGATPALLYSGPGAPTWRAVAGVAAEGAPEGFTRYRFTFAQGGLRADLSGTAISRAQVELIPYLNTAPGPRVFDHNANADPLTNYTLSAPSGFALEAPPGLCEPPPPLAPEATVHFTGDWTVRLEGTLRAGGAVAVDYDLGRLPECFNDRYMGRATWGTTAYVRFTGADELLATRPLLDCAEVACDAPRGRLAVFDVPEGATRMELWFATAGRSCGVHWDSDFGRNYGFDVLGEPGWVGDFTAAISRAGGGACTGGGSIADGVFYGTWARQRAARADLCVRAWVPGTTDVGEGIGVQAGLRCRWTGEDRWRTYGLSHHGREGNNAVLVASLRGLDPLAAHRCPDMPLLPAAESGGYDTVSAQCQALVNGVAYGPRGEGDSFSLTFADYPADAWRAAHCAP